jgi:hypothetical protein
MSACPLVVSEVETTAGLSVSARLGARYQRIRLCRSRCFASETADAVHASEAEACVVPLVLGRAHPWSLVVRPPSADEQQGRCHYRSAELIEHSVSSFHPGNCERKRTATKTSLPAGPSQCFRSGSTCRDSLRQGRRFQRPAGCASPDGRCWRRRGQFRHNGRN